MPVRHLIAAVYVQDPTSREVLILLPGESPAPEIAALITNPDAWDEPPPPVETEVVEVHEVEATISRSEAETTVEELTAADGGGTKKAPPRRPRSSGSS
ncbi:hypothetical protein [Streptomyces sp. 769]|uniref:hypothetical protein n=1 Tax=Streptomyces sp. 769 TaxID=1262452 RepID=UPI00057E5A70|nr:hypothetical protein [Streptomyces sp. 769]AJC58567.1 hypothetical protein GZL_05994 [Streptomyces sp. 769]